MSAAELANNQQPSLDSSYQSFSDVNLPDYAEEDDGNTLEADFAMYNQMYESHVLFQQSFDLERRRYQLALQTSLKELLTRLPQSVLSMPAEQFLASKEADLVGLEEFKVPQGSMEVMAQIAMLFDAQTDKPNQNLQKKEIVHRANEISAMVEADEVARRLDGNSPLGARVAHSALNE